MMYTRVAALFLAALPALAAATPVLESRGGGGGSSSSCSTGELKCCNSLQSASDPGMATLAGLLGIALGSLTGQVGVNCSPISVISVASGNACSAQSVCCTNNSYGSVLSAGCVPVEL